MIGGGVAMSAVSTWLDVARAGHVDGRLGVAPACDLVELPGHAAVVADVDDRGAVGAEPLAPAQRLERARVAQEVVAAAVVEVAEHHER